MDRPPNAGRDSDRVLAAAAPGELRLAATVMLIKDTAAGLEVFVLRRAKVMAFAPGMMAFPGGGVDPTDHDPSIGWLGPDATWWARQLGTTPVNARALVVAAVRELFEETGVLLATQERPDGQATDSAAGALAVGAAAGADPAQVALAGDIRSAAALDDAVRVAILDRRLQLSAALSSAGLLLSADLLRPWANWVTPPAQSRRYDTFFFVAVLPEGQQARHLTTEADLGYWRTPQAVLAEHDVGAVAMLPPTRAMLSDLAGFASVSDVMAAQRVITPVHVRRALSPEIIAGQAERETR